MDSILPGERGNRRATALWLQLDWRVTKNGNIHVNWNLEPIGFNESLICGTRFSQNKDMSDWKSWFVYDATEGIVEDMKPGKSYYVEFAIVDDMDDYESVDELPWRGKHKVSNMEVAKISRKGRLPEKQRKQILLPKKKCRIM